MDTFRENLIKKIGQANLEKIRETTIGIAGAGGLGSNCALNLIRSGAGRLVIVDFDTIQPANLDRQFYFSDQIGMGKVEALSINLKRVNPDIELKIIPAKIEKSNIENLFAGCDIVVECLDRPEYKSILVSELMRLDKFIVAASGLGGYGSSDDIKTHRFKKNLIMVGDLKSDIEEKPALSPRVNIAAAKQADAVLEYIFQNRKRLRPSHSAL